MTPGQMILKNMQLTVELTGDSISEVAESTGANIGSMLNDPNISRAAGFIAVEYKDGSSSVIGVSVETDSTGEAAARLIHTADQGVKDVLNMVVGFHATETAEQIKNVK